MTSTCLLAIDALRTENIPNDYTTLETGKPRGGPLRDGIKHNVPGRCISGWGPEALGQEDALRCRSCGRGSRITSFVAYLYCVCPQNPSRDSVQTPLGNSARDMSARG